MSPFGEHQFFIVEEKFAFFGNVNHVGSDEKLQGLLTVITPGEHSPEYGLRFQPQLFNVHGFICSDGIIMPERLDYFRDSMHCQPVGDEYDRYNEKYDY